MKTLSNRQDFNAIRSRIESLTADDQRLWGSMTVGGMVCHLSDAFKVAAGEKPTAKARFGVIPGPVMKWMALRAPVKWPRHAIFGAMTASDWMRWGFLHADHHLRQFGR